MKWITRLIGGLCLFFVSACALTPRPEASVIASLPSSTPPLSAPLVSPVKTPFPQEYGTPPLFTPPPHPSEPTPWPTIQYDLLFKSSIDPNNYKLMRWHHLTAQNEVLIRDEVEELSSQPGDPAPSRIAQFSLSADNQTLAVVRIRQKPKGAAFVDEYELALFDFRSGQLTTLVKLETPVIWSAISPDGQWLAFMSWETPRTIHVLKTSAPGQALEIGSCDEECWDFVWSPDSRILAWSDSQGVWLSSVDDAQPRLIASNKSLVLTDGQRAVYAPPPWSPNGHYLLVHSRDIEVGEISIVDIQTGRLGALPDSHEYPYSNVHTVWLNDGSLFVVRNGDAYVKKSPSYEIWRVDPKVFSLLILDKYSDIPVSSLTYPTAPTQFDDGRLGFVLLALSEANNEESGLYTLSPTGQPPRRFSASLPLFDDPGSVYASWLPDGTGAIIHNETGPIQRIYVPANDKMPLTLPDLNFGLTCCFVWLK